MVHVANLLYIKGKPEKVITIISEMSAGTPPNTPDKKGSNIPYFEEKKYSLPRMLHFLEDSSSMLFPIAVPVIQDFDREAPALFPSAIHDHLENGFFI
ncbi:unnamed protein product [Caenorhabditis nigoni]